MAEFSHFDKDGKAIMVDVGDKAVTRREAVARGRVEMQAETLQAIMAGEMGKGDVLGVARLAGIMAAKKCSDLIPLCHPLPLTSVSLDFTLSDGPLPCIEIEAVCRTDGKTGVEMEALTATSVAALTIYDMCKAMDRSMHLTDIRLAAKSGGKSGDYREVP